MNVTAYHARYYVHDLTRRASTGLDRLSMSLFDAAVDLNPHQKAIMIVSFNYANALREEIKSIAWDMGVRVSVPLPGGGGRRADSQMARTQAAIAAQQEALTYRDILNTIATVHAAAVSGYSSWQSARLAWRWKASIRTPQKWRAPMRWVKLT